MKKIRFAVIGDCHYSQAGNYANRDCLGAKKRLQELINILNREPLNFVLSLGDIGNGDDKAEIPEMLEVFKQSVHQVRFVIGNHDLVLRTADEVAELFGIPSPFYDFVMRDYRFIMLNAFEQSRYCLEGSKEYESYKQFIKENDWRKVQPWPGIMTDESWEKLDGILKDAKENRQKVIVFSHVPTDGFGGSTPARLPEYQRMLDLLESYPNVKAYIAGHCHGGGISVRNGILHKTLRSVCDYEQPTACIFEVDEKKMKIQGIGSEDNFIHYYVTEPSVLSGTAPENCWVMTNCGEIMKVGADGKFSLEVPCPGMYAVKAVMDGCEDCYIPMVEAPASELKIEFKPNIKKKLYCGKTDGYSLLRIKDGDKPVRWFDIAGTEFGAVEPIQRMWHEHSKNYWAKDAYAFTAEGEVSIRILPRHGKLKDEGWYKGDLHAHLIHGENIYVGNIQQSAFIGRSEGYDWLYMASYHGNDGYPTDIYTMAKKLSGPDFLYRINEEFPKSVSNHFGNCGVGPVNETVDTTKISSLELAEKYIWSKGGVTIPVHPFFGHMSFRELCLWVLCAPEKLPCIDFFYDDDFPREMAEDYWFMLLNRGYEIGCFSTSDAAFDVGRTPGSDRGATYLHMETLTENNIKKAILEGRTMVTWDCAAILFSIGDAISGDKLLADDMMHMLKVRVFWQKDRKGTLRIIRCGEDVRQVQVSFRDDNEEWIYEMPVSEIDNCWYVVILESEDGKIRSVASPVYFRNNMFKAPETIRIEKPIPQDILAECEELTPEQLARPELLDEFYRKLKALEV